MPFSLFPLVCIGTNDACQAQQMLLGTMQAPTIFTGENNARWTDDKRTGGGSDSRYWPQPVLRGGKTRGNPQHQNREASSSSDGAIEGDA
jgi:hypothetical protein